MIVVFQVLQSLVFCHSSSHPVSNALEGSEHAILLGIGPVRCHQAYLCHSSHFSQDFLFILHVHEAYRICSSKRKKLATQ